MKQKVVIISLFLVVGLFFSSLLSLTSLSITKQIKSTLNEDKNELFVVFEKHATEEKKVLKDKKSNELLKGLAKWLTKPLTGEINVVEEKRNVEEVLTTLNAKEKLLPSEDTNPKTTLKVAVYCLLFFILLFLIIYFLRKRYKKNNQKSGKNLFPVEEEQIRLAGLKNNDGIRIPSFTKKERIETSIPIHEIRRLLQEWEARLVGKSIKKEAETINEWFERINGPVDIIPIYEKIRYGEQNCTEEEVNFIKNNLEL